LKKSSPQHTTSASSKLSSAAGLKAKLLALFPDLSRRCDEPELMDDPNTSAPMLQNTLRLMAMLNRYLLFHRRLLKRHVIKDMLANKIFSATLLDVGAGVCDIDLWLIRVAASKGLRLDVTALDHDDRVIEYAKAMPHSDRLTIVRANAVDIDKLGRSFDYIFANHLLHHIPAVEIPVLLCKMASACKRLFLVNDLARGNLSYLAFSLGTAPFARNSFAYYDGRLSIKKGFTLTEFQCLASELAVPFTLEVGRAFPAHLYIAARRKE
jgi:2-polyprenyl-3-methyl-5-hydroxy-6-metoxy-1,4-benzoquinol methylase